MDLKNGSVESVRLLEENFQNASEIPDDVYQAITNDDLDTVRQIMESWKPLQQMSFLTPKAKKSPVLEACEFNSLNCLKYFLKLHERYRKRFLELEVDQVDGFVCAECPELRGRTAIHLLAMRPGLSEAASILENDHSMLLKDIINREDASGTTPLLTAVKRNNEKVAKYLVRNGAVFDKIYNRQSPMNIAVANGLIDVVQEMWKTAPEENKSKLVKNCLFYGKGHSIFYPTAMSGKDDLFKFLYTELGPEAVKLLSVELKHSDMKTFLSNISSSGMKFAIMELMESPDWPKLKTWSNTATPLMWAVKGRQMEMVRTILEHHYGKEMVEMKDKQGRNVFHYAAEQDQDILKYLMQEEYSHLFNERDKGGCTPLHLAVAARLRENCDLLWKYDSKLNNESIFHCQFCVQKCSDEMMEYVLLKFKDCADETAFSRFLQSQGKKRRTPMHEAALAGRTEILKLLLKNLGPSSILDRSPYFNWSALHFAVASKSLPTVEFLVDTFPEMVNWRSNDDETAAVLAAESGCAEILKFLLKKGATVCGEYPRENLLDCVTKYTHIQHRRETALEIVNYCCRDGKIDDLKQLMQNSQYGSEGIMSKLLKQMPSVALEILNNCAQDNEEMTPKSRSKTQTYHIFPVQDEETDGKGLLAIRTMIKYNCYDCLGHPVVVKFLDMKWNSSTARLWYFSNIILYAAFLLSLTVYIWVHTKGTYRLTSPSLIGLSLVSIVVIVLNICKEIMQIVFGWKEYFFDPNNYMEWVIYVSAAIYLIPLDKEKSKSQIQAGAIAVFLAWINFIWFFKRLSLFGIYIIMAKKVFTSLLKVLPMVILFIFAFSMVFFLLMNDDDGYQNLSTAMLTTSVMMAGEIDFRGVFLPKDKGPHILLERLFLVCFLIIITIVIMNLLVGLAVGDTDETMKRSKAEKRFYKASLIVALQRSMSHMPWISLEKVEDPFNVDVKEEEKTMPWLVWLWEKVYRDNEVDDADETKMILARLGKLEESMGQIKTLLEKLTTNSKGAEDKEA